MISAKDATASPQTYLRDLIRSVDDARLQEVGLDPATEVHGRLDLTVAVTAKIAVARCLVLTIDPERSIAPLARGGAAFTFNQVRGLRWGPR